MSDYGKELIMDLHNCDSSTFNRKSIKLYFERLCVLIDMKRAKLCWWDDFNVPLEERETEPHLKGTSAVQFIRTSDIVIHTLDLLGNVYLNIFSCKDFDDDIVIQFSEEWFKGKLINKKIVRRI